MKSVNVNLNEAEKVKTFVGIVSSMEGDFDLISDRYVINAKSLLGIFSLDLSKPVRLDIHCDDVADKAMPLLSDYIVK